MLERSAALSSPLISKGLFKAATPAIGYQRPPEVQVIVDKKFSILAASQDDPGYHFVGDEDYRYWFYERAYVDVSAIIQSKIDMQHLVPLKVLDIGAGNFLLSEVMEAKYGEKVKMYGITAQDIFRYESERIVDRYHVIGNAENLSAVFPEESFDLIVSHMTFTWFHDPVGSLIEAYKKLSPGGTLVIDKLKLRGCELFTNNIMQWLKSQGYLITGQCKAGEIAPLVIRKPGDGSLSELIFPVMYDSYSESAVDDIVIYKPHSAVLALSRNAVKKYCSGAKAALHHGKEIQSLLVNECDNLPALFNNPTYQQLDMQTQYYLILAVNAKSIDYADYMNIYSNLADKNLNNRWFNLYVLCGMNEYAGHFMFRLANRDQSDQIKTPEDILHCIQYMAGREFITMTLIVELLKDLNELNIPYTQQSLTNAMHRGRSDCLTFPSIVQHYQEELSQQPGKNYSR